MPIERKAAAALTTEIMEAVDAVLARHGMTAAKPRTGYGPFYTLKFEATEATIVNGVNTSSSEAQAYRASAHVYGLPADGLGRTFVSNGKRFTVAGLRPKARTRPVLTLGEDGKDYVWAAEAVARMLAACVAGAA